MLDWFDYVRFALTLFGVLNPFAAIPTFLMLTSGRTDADTHRIAGVAGFSVFVALLVAALSGDLILRLLGTSLAAFQVGGGVVLFLVALAMINARMSPQQQTAEEAHEAEGRDAVGVVPLALPLLVGPGSLSTTVIVAQRGDGVPHFVLVVLALAVVAISVWIILRIGPRIGARLGRTGLNIVNRIFGLLLAAVAVQILANGLKGLFPGLG
jgi:multiple antibiotic resistance protein